MRLIIDLGGRTVEELHPSEANARTHLSIVLNSHKSRGHIVAKRQKPGRHSPRFVVQTPQGWLQYWLEH